MSKIKEYKSDTDGLWGRFISKLIAAWIFVYFVSLVITISILETVFPDLYAPDVLIIFIPALLIFVTWLLAIENPLRWGNTVIFDLEKEMVSIKKTKDDNSNSAILDFDGNHYSTKDIDSYSTREYESFIFIPFYLIKIYVKGKEVRFLSVKRPNDFVTIVKILEKDFKIKPR